MMKIDPARFMGGYAAVMTLGCAWFALGGALTPQAKFETIDVERINVREADGTLRMVIANRAKIPGIIIAGTEYPNENRTQAGMIFYNDEGSENGGLVFEGGRRNGKTTNVGHLSFDRWHQDQTLYMQSVEDGPRRRAGVFVQDRPDKPIDFAEGQRILKTPGGASNTAALLAAGYDGRLQRAFLGRDYDDSSRLDLRDGAGKTRLRLKVEKSGAAVIEFLDDTGKVTRTLGAS